MAVLWAADYDQGPPEQFWTLQQPTPGRIATAAPPLGGPRPEGTALRVRLAPGDLYNSSGYVAPRCEVMGKPEPVDVVRWYGFSVYVPSGFPFATDTSWLILTQWKGQLGGSPPVGVEIKRSGLRLGGTRTNAGLVPGDGALGAIVTDTWTRIAVGLRLSATDGWVQVYRDGREALPRTAVATLDMVGGQPDPVYVKQGIYRQDPSLDQTLYFGPLLVGERLRDVA